MLDVVILLINDLSNEAYVPNKKENLNLTLFSMITGINKSKALIKNISCEYKCRFDGRKCNLESHLCQKDCVSNRATCNCENSKCLANIQQFSNYM